MIERCRHCGERVDGPTCTNADVEAHRRATVRVLDLPLAQDDISTLAAALDSHVYWQLTPSEHRNDGYCMGLPTSPDDLDDLRNCFRLMRAIGEDPGGWGWCDPDDPDGAHRADWEPEKPAPAIVFPRTRGSLWRDAVGELFTWGEPLPDGVKDLVEPLERMCDHRGCRLLAVRTDPEMDAAYCGAHGGF